MFHISATAEPSRYGGKEMLIPNSARSRNLAAAACVIGGCTARRVRRGCGIGNILLRRRRLRHALAIFRCIVFVHAHTRAQGVNNVHRDKLCASAKRKTMESQIAASSTSSSSPLKVVCSCGVCGVRLPPTAARLTALTNERTRICHTHTRSSHIRTVRI